MNRSRTALSKSPDIPMLSSRSSALSPRASAVSARHFCRHCKHREGGGSGTSGRGLLEPRSNLMPLDEQRSQREG